MEKSDKNEFKGKDKLIHMNKIGNVVNELKKQGKTIVTTNGAFDIFHLGHLRLLKEAKKLGDVLIVGLNSDTSVKLSKGDTRPINSQIDRAAFLLELDFVNYVVIFYDENSINFIKEIKPHVHVKDRSWGKNPVEREAVEEGGGKLYLVDKFQDLSTSNIVKKIIGLCKAQHKCDKKIGKI